ncbi:MAG: efflux RND transporter periplasmic adaptor subunit [Bacteroidales bacterium]|nr:efflux RND transporter periplasmic adaptor subunit [Bacteroidales bacterium]
MKKIFFFGIALMGTMLLGACHSDHAHDGHDHSAEEHNHEAEGHDHEAEADGHNHEADEHDHDADEHAGHSAEITFTEAQAKAAGLRLVTVEPGEFAEVVEVTGRLLPAQGDEATVSATMAGIVSQATKNLADGAAVRQGQQLFVINASAMADGNPAAAARAELEAARKALARAEQLAAEKLLPQRELDEARSRFRTAEAAARSLGNETRTRAVAAPFTGYVKEVLVRPGDYVQPGQPLATVTQSQRLQLSADLPERHFALLPQIQDATFRLSYEPAGTAHCVSEMGGSLVSKGKASSATGFSVPVTFELPNRGRLVSGSFAQVYLQGATRKGVITVPNEALTEAQGLFFVYVQIHPERYQRQEVTIGATDGHRTEIRSGLTAGQHVVAQGATQVRLAANATVIPEGHSH